MINKEHDMKNDAMWSMFQRLGKSSETHLASEYMGKAEYEFGAAHAGLYAMCVDIGAKHEIIETNIRMTEKDMPFGYKMIKEGPKARQTKKEWRKELAEFEPQTAMTDGQPLLLRYMPEIAKEEDFADFIKAEGLDDFNNAGGMIRRDTRAWLCLSPVVGILYHPTQEKAVEQYIETLTNRYADSIPDPEERKASALGKLSQQREFISIDGAKLRDLKERSPDTTPSM